MVEKTSPFIVVEVVFAQQLEQITRQLQVSPDCSAEQAVCLAGLQSLWSSVGGSPLALACFGKLIQPNQRLFDGDRVEILRPLLADPKEQRRNRADRDQRARRRQAKN